MDGHKTSVTFATSVTGGESNSSSGGSDSGRLGTPGPANATAALNMFRPLPSGGAMHVAAHAMPANMPTPPPQQHHHQQQQAPIAGTNNAAAPPPPRANSVLRKIMQQTIGEQYEFATLPKVQSLIASMDTYLATSESLVSLGKSVYMSGAVVFVVDAMMRVILWNDTAIQLIGFSREELAGRNLVQECATLVPPATANRLADALARCLQNVPVPAMVIPLIKRDGSQIALLATCTPLLSNPVGQGMLVTAHEVQGIMETVRNATADAPAMVNMPPGAHPMMAAHNAMPAMQMINPNAAAVPIPVQVTSNAVKVAGWSEIAPNYSIECVLGQGSYGQVVRCKHLPTGDIVAIKKIQNVFSDPIDAKRILRELCIVRQLRHPNIVQLREIIVPHDLNSFRDLFVVFEYLPTDLEKLLHSPQFLTAEHLRWLLMDLLRAVKYMHSAEIVHRDLKPANVLLNLSPVAIKLADFGLARGLSSKSSTNRKRKHPGDADSEDLTLEGAGVHPRTPAKRIERHLTEHVVTRWYRAPEIIFRDHDYSPAIDMWSVGCIFAELLSMQKSSVPSHYQREPLFPGVSCFPLSPGAGQAALPQDSRDQLNTILDVLGTMSEDDIEDISDPDVRTYLRSLPPRPKKSLQEMYPGAEPEAINLLEWMLQMNPKKRATLDEALSHEYLSSIRSLEEEIVAPNTITLDFDEKKMTVSEIRSRMIEEVRFFHPDEVPPRNGKNTSNGNKKSKQ